MQKITPFLWFDDQAEAAAKFYVSVFKKRSKILSVSRYGDAGPGPKGSVMVVEFQLEGQRFLALNGGPTFKLSPAFSFVVTCKTQKKMDTYWKKLTSGGGVPNQCGWLTDKFGLSWQIVPDPHRQGDRRQGRGEGEPGHGGGPQDAEAGSRDARAGREGRAQAQGGLRRATGRWPRRTTARRPRRSRWC